MSMAADDDELEKLESELQEAYAHIQELEAELEQGGQQDAALGELEQELGAATERISVLESDLESQKIAHSELEDKYASKTAEAEQALRDLQVSVMSWFRTGLVVLTFGRVSFFLLLTGLLCLLSDGSRISYF